MRCPESPILVYNRRLHTVAQMKANRPSRIVSAAGRASSPCARLEHNSTSNHNKFVPVGARHLSGRSKVGPLSIYTNIVCECKLLAPKCEGGHSRVAGIVDKEPPNPTVSILDPLTQDSSHRRYSLLQYLLQGCIRPSVRFESSIS
jgi:hypothetical protein